MNINLDKYITSVEGTDPLQITGRVVNVVGLVIEALGPQMAIGEVCEIIDNESDMEPVRAEVVGFRDSRVLLMPLGDLKGINPGCRIVALGKPTEISVSNEMLGRVLDGLGRPIDGKGPLAAGVPCAIYRNPPAPLERERIKHRVSTGIKAIDGFLTCGIGQRLGIFSGSGVGKSTLLGMIARNTSADINVIALIGERGREVKDFLEKDLGEEGLQKSVVVVATSDQPALVRKHGAFLATAISEYFRDNGNDVLFMMDSITRFCTAQREVGLSIGEPPATKGYTPSVFALLPKLLERTGAVEEGGSITGLYTILVEGDDFNEPISDSVRAILDGHIVLSRELASQNHYPAIDLLASISRLMPDVITPEHQAAADRIRQVLSTYYKSEDLITIGAYVKGSDKDLDYAIDNFQRIKKFLRQDKMERSEYDLCIDSLKTLLSEEVNSEELQST